jgi:hypothetical protein
VFLFTLLFVQKRLSKVGKYGGEKCCRTDVRSPDCLAAYDELLAKLPEEDREKLQRSNGNVI